MKKDAGRMKNGVGESVRRKFHAKEVKTVALYLVLAIPMPKSSDYTITTLATEKKQRQLSSCL